MLNFTARDRLIDWLFCITRLCFCQRFENGNKTLASVVEAYFLSSNKASNITTLKANVLSPNSWYKQVDTWFICFWNLFTNQKQVICLYQKSYTELIERSISTQYWCRKFFNVWGYSGRFQDWEKQNKVRSLTTWLQYVNKWTINELDIKKQLLLKKNFKKKIAIFIATLGNITVAANCLNIVCKTHNMVCATIILREWTR